jgi:polygalacturonase
MRFLEIILNNSDVKEAKLYNASKKASENPDTGITIQTKSAYHVIKDCARIANLYLPIYIFGRYNDPFESLKGKFTRKDIEEFLNSCTNSNLANYQLYQLILEKIKQNSKIEEPKEVVVVAEVNPDDPYGDYGYSQSEIVSTQKQNKDFSSLEIFCQAFVVSS